MEKKQKTKKLPKSPYGSLLERIQKSLKANEIPEDTKVTFVPSTKKSNAAGYVDPSWYERNMTGSVMLRPGIEEPMPIYYNPEHIDYTNQDEQLADLSEHEIMHQGEFQKGLLPTGEKDPDARHFKYGNFDATPEEVGQGTTKVGEYTRALEMEQALRKVKDMQNNPWKANTLKDGLR